MLRNNEIKNTRKVIKSLKSKEILLKEITENVITKKEDSLAH